MTLRQKILKLIYPLFLFYKKLKGKHTIFYNKDFAKPFASFYNLSVDLNDGSTLSFENLTGKKILLVNTASDCGYTGQYKQLQQLQDQFPNQLLVMAFPANDFKQQEKENDKTIAEFCSSNYGIRFPLAKKSHVLKKAGQNEVFRWLTTKELNGWNDKQPSWNFSKYLVDEKGMLTHYFDPAISPVEKSVTEAVQKVNIFFTVS